MGKKRKIFISLCAEFIITGVIVLLCPMVFLTCTTSFEKVEPEVLVEICDNGIDDTGNGLTDCEDPACADDAACAPVEICDSGLDDDGDGLTDCEDPDCAEEWFCNEPQPCNLDWICNTFEHPFWCDDCCPDGSIEQGDAYDYIFSEIIAPETDEDAEKIGVDVNYDGKVDNALAGFFVLFPASTGESLNSDLNEAVQNGEYLVLGRMHVSAWPTDEAIAIQVFQGAASEDATQDNLSGQGTVNIADGEDRSLFLKGELIEGMVETCPGTIRFPFYLDSTVLNLKIEKTRFVSTGEITEDGWEEMMIGGGLSRQTIDDQLLSALVVYLNRKTLENPNSTHGFFVRHMLDAKCNPDLPECDHVVNGEGECTTWSEDPDEPPLTFTELKCNSFIYDLLEPDIDSNGDGEKDLLSVGFRVKAIKVKILN